MVPATVQAAMRGLQPQQKQKVAEVAQQLVDQKKSALDSLRELKAQQHVRTGAAMVGAAIVSVEAGATDGLAEAMGIPRPLGIRPSHIKGVAALGVAGIAWWMGYGGICEAAAAAAGGNLLPHGYNLGFGAVTAAKKALDAAKKAA